MNFQRNCLTLVTLLALISCTKSRPTNYGNWTLVSSARISAQYNVVKTQRVTSTYFIFSGVDPKTPQNILNVYFAQMPTINGNYEVVAFDNDIPLLANQVGIRANIPSVGVYSSTGIANNQTWAAAPPIGVIVSNGKLRIEIPLMTTKIVTSNYLDTAMLNGHISEY